MSPKLRIHYAKWKCPHFAGFDNYTDIPGLVTCPFCKRELASAAELKRAPVRAEQPCPSCNGYGELLDTEAEAYALCPDCDGTGSANRSAGG
jgi:DnaJ-class molecular chaperone